MTTILLIFAAAAITGLAVYRYVRWRQDWWASFDDHSAFDVVNIADTPVTVPEWTIAGDAFTREAEFGWQFRDMLHERAKGIAESNGRRTIVRLDVEQAGDEAFSQLIGAMLPPEFCKPSFPTQFAEAVGRIYAPKESVAAAKRRLGEQCPRCDCGRCGDNEMECSYCQWAVAGELAANATPHRH